MNVFSNSILPIFRTQTTTKTRHYFHVGTYIAYIITFIVFRQAKANSLQAKTRAKYF